MRSLKKIVVILVLIVAGLALAWNFSEPPPLPEESISVTVLANGPYEVGTHEYTLADASRPTQANKEFPGAPRRTLHTRAWFPLDSDGKNLPDQALPLIVYSHGFFGNSEEPRYLAEYLASHGYLVVAADFPLTNYRAPGGANVMDVMNQPGDVSFLIDTLLEWNREPGNRFHRRVDAERIALAGLSLGGMTTELAAYHPRVRDLRVKAAISIAGPLQLFGRRFFEQSQLPFMMIAGDIDAMVPYEDNARPVLERINNAWLVSIHGASHTGFSDQASMLRWLDNADSIGCYFVAGKTPDAADDIDLYSLLGSEDEGILRNMDNRLCRVDPLPPAISPLLQHRIVILAVRAFLESVFNPDDAERERYRDYLQRVLPSEIGGVTVERSSPPAG
ncbi:MAG: alpha/beta fold hydrolase [Pseudomonadales bacterium]|nr:alpha/beta fold hydrolase [Gammaproteobacteria bacterium]MBP6052054.1 alpha/beta fold hydrolase [Pseudomonadales bacterium]MBK6585244.1 alpha/beta fold hydrolase [Gammaproteobacteria bacterium]MBK7520033.1 alpha/beta fold hydrolase [Gammaproteobacteria bacterium]MBK8306251.1 alpha/beta fold hydrolase [Gammaproteobacteria bacterium]